MCSHVYWCICLFSLESETEKRLVNSLDVQVSLSFINTCIISFAIFLQVIKKHDKIGYEFERTQATPHFVTVEEALGNVLDQLAGYLLL